jgi:hypothetical protein
MATAVAADPAMFNRNGDAASVEELEEDAARCNANCQLSIQFHLSITIHLLRSTAGARLQCSKMMYVLSYLCSLNRAIPNNADRARRGQA